MLSTRTRLERPCTIIALSYAECLLRAVFTQLPERSILKKLTLLQTVHYKYLHVYNMISAFRNNYKYANVAMTFGNDVTSPKLVNYIKSLSSPCLFSFWELAG